MSLGISALNSDDIAKLDAFLGTPVTSLATGREFNTIVTCYLDLLESMWMSQALKERQCDSWFSTLRNLHVTGVR